MHVDTVLEHSPEDEPGVGVSSVVPVGLVLVVSVGPAAGIKYIQVKPSFLNYNAYSSYLADLDPLILIVWVRNDLV